MPLVSVAVITYNMEKYLPKLLDSILEQKVDFEYEIVINDDCSPDNSRQIILDYQAKYPRIIKTCFGLINVGGSRNMYGVMQQCSGKYIAILEGDDWWEDKNKLQYQVNFLESHPEYIGMTCNSWCDHGDEPEYNQLMRNRNKSKVFTYQDFMSRDYIDRLPNSTDTWMFRNIFNEFPNEDFSLMYRAHNMIWDQALILLLYGKGNIYADPKVVSHHRSVAKLDGTNYQSIIIQKNMLYSDSQMYQRMEEYIENILCRNCNPFYLVRGDVWIDAIFKALITHKIEDKRIAKKIYNDQQNKELIFRLFVLKSVDILRRKLKRK